MKHSPSETSVNYKKLNAICWNEKSQIKISTRCQFHSFHLISRVWVKCLSSLVYLHPAVSLWMCWVGGQAGLKEGVVTGEDKQVGACMCGTSWAVVSLANLVIHQTESIHRPHHSLYLQPLCSPPTQGPSVRLSAKPGISTLISHLWHPNELRLLLHL